MPIYIQLGLGTVFCTEARPCVINYASLAYHTKVFQHLPLQFPCEVIMTMLISRGAALLQNLWRTKASSAAGNMSVPGTNKSICPCPGTLILSVVGGAHCSGASSPCALGIWTIRYTVGLEIFTILQFNVSCDYFSSRIGRII